MNSDDGSDTNSGSDDGMYEIPNDDKIQFVYQILTSDEVLKNMDDTIAQINSALQFPITTIRILLNHFKWNREGLMDRLFGDDQDQDKIFRELEIPNPFTASSQVAKKKKIDDKEQNECEVCCEFYQDSELIGLECGHRFCYDCWNDHLNSKILDQGTDRISCLQYQCNTLMDQAKCLEILRDSRARQIYKRLITRSFVECNHVLLWCPNPKCEMVIEVDYTQEEEPITCSCNFNFCCKCLKDWHIPLNCDLLQKWSIKLEDDSETRNWLTVNSRNCPNCRSAIEKSGGCNHMTCGKINCRHEFCWICMATWEDDFYQTHRCLYENNHDMEHEEYTEREENTDEAAQLAKEALDWYLIHHLLYETQKQSLQLEEKLMDNNVKIKVKNLITGGVDMEEEAALLEAGVITLKRCRKTLMYTYPFAYFLDKEHSQTIIFKNNQADLERATENLSECIEREMMDQVCFTTLKVKFIHLCQYCKDRCQVLEKHVKEGYTGLEGIEDTKWKFTENALN